MASSRSGREHRRRIPRGLIAGLVVVLVFVAVPLLRGIGDDSDHGGSKSTSGGALRSVRAAVGQTIASGGYDNTFETSTEHPSRCPQGAACPAAGTPTTFDSSGTGTVSFDPYVSHVVTDGASTLGPHTLYVTATTIWEGSGPSLAPGVRGIPLSGFATAVEGALGPSQGALSMISLASPGGAINLEQAAVSKATPDGDGTVDGFHVTYYDVTIDMTQLADTPDLTDEQRQTISDALPLLQQGGYTGTTERIGVDDAGFVREVNAENHFSDGSTGIRHSVLFNFGCAPKQYAPDQSPPAVTTTRPCLVPATSTTTPSTTMPSTTTPPSTTMGSSTTTTAPPTTTPPSTSSPPTTGSPPTSSTTP
jgi:hypothetical protein